MLDVFEYGHGPAIVLLHGAGVDAHLWDPQIKQFSKQHRLIVVTLPGHGNSPLVKGGIPGIAKAVHDEIRTLGLCGYTVIGMSLGGMVALEIAARWPDEVSRLVLAESVASVTDSNLGRNTAQVLLWLLRIIPPKLIAKLPASMMGGYRRESGLYVKKAIANMTSRNAYAIMKAALLYDGRPLLSRIKARTLVLVGEKNRHTHERAKAMANHIAGCEYSELPDAGHILNRDAPAEFSKKVLSFVDHP